MTYYLTDRARVIENEIAAGATQPSVATTYAMAMRSASAGVWVADWRRVNRAIWDRWSMAGLERVKKLAHTRLVVPTEGGVSHKEMPR